MKQITISDAEWQVMNVIWEGQPLAAQEIVAALENEADWAAATIKTMLHRLVKKDVLTYQKQANRYVYRARMKRANCVRKASRSFMERVFDGEPALLLAHFLKNSNLSAEEVSELRSLLNEQEAQQ